MGDNTGPTPAQRVGRTTPPALALVPETEARLWSVRTTNGLYLVVACREGYLYDVHHVSNHTSGDGVDFVGTVDGQVEALELIDKDTRS